MRSILSLVLFVAVVYCQYDAGANSIAAQLCTDAAKPLRCQYSSVCVAYIGECPINNCTGNAPFLCSDLVTCVKSAQDCNCPGVICPDGSCKGGFDFCPLLEGCDESFPKRCPDGTCQPYNSDCTNHTGRTCPSGMTLCIDGICRTSCSGLRYAGCPIFQCPNGTCSTTYTPCLCPNDATKAKCFDGSCTPLGVKCTNKAPAFVQPMNQTYTVNTAQPSSISIQLAPTTSTAPSNSLGSVTVPTSGVAPVSGSFSLVNVQGAPSTLTNSITAVNPVTSGVLRPTLASPAISISAPAQTTLSSPGSISLNAPSGIPASSLCVGLVNNTNSVISCLPTTVTKRDFSNTLTSELTTLGVYALMFRPTCQVDGSQSANAFCASHNWDPLPTGYYCADNGNKFYQCYTNGGITQGALISCAPGTKCRCCSSDECSLSNTQSPCTSA